MKKPDFNTNNVFGCVHCGAISSIDFIERQLLDVKNAKKANHELLDLITEHWREHFYPEMEPYTFAFYQNRLGSVVQFIKKLPFSDVYQAVSITAVKFEKDEPDTFKYFCGICWQTIRSGVPHHA